MYYQYASEYEHHCTRVKEELSKNPSLIDNELYIFKNLPFLGLTFTDFSEKMRNNSIFILQYFTYIKSNKKEYRLIPSEFLDNLIFLDYALAKNPDIYLLLSEEQKNGAYEIMAKRNPSKILKYASKEVLKNEEYCKKIVLSHTSNYPYAPENVKTNKEVCKAVFFFSEEASFIKYLPEWCLNDKEFIQEVLNHPNSFPYLPNFYKEDAEFCLKFIMKNSKFFEHISPLLKDNKNFIEQILSGYELKKDNIELSDFELSDILKHLQFSDFDINFLHLFDKEIHSQFSNLNKEQRSSLPIIKTAFHLFKNTSDKDQLNDFIKLIGHPALKESLKDFIKQNRYMPINNLLIEFDKIIEPYFFHEQLQNTLVISDDKTKKLKI